MTNEPTVDYSVLTKALTASDNQLDRQKAVADAPFTTLKVEMALLFLGFISFFLVDEAEQQVYLAGTSDTEEYRLSVKDYPFDPKKFRLDLTDRKNHIVRAIVENQPVHNGDWSQLSRPNAQTEAVRLNQASSGIAASYIYPLAGQPRGALMYNFFQFGEDIGTPQLEFMARYTALVSSVLSA